MSMRVRNPDRERGGRWISADVAVPPFVPTDVAGLVGWYDFSDITTLWQDTGRTSAVTADAQLIKGVTDKSAALNHLSEAGNPPTYKAAIQNGKSVSRYSNVHSLTSASNSGISGNASATLVCVTTGSSIDNKGMVEVGDEAASLTVMALYQGVTANLFSVEFGGGNGWRPATGVTKAAWNIIEGVKSPGAINTTTTIRLNGTLGTGGSGSASTPNITNGVIRLGRMGLSGGFLTGDIAEAFLFNSAVAAGDLTSLRAYLSTKWNITVA